MMVRREITSTEPGLAGRLMRRIGLRRDLPSHSHHHFSGHRQSSAWGGFIDGLNRLPRPLMALGVIALMAWPAINPQTFAEAMQGYAMMPDWLVQLVMAVVLAYFVSRTVEKMRQPPSVSGPSRVEMPAPTLPLPSAPNTPDADLGTAPGKPSAGRVPVPQS